MVPAKRDRQNGLISHNPAATPAITAASPAPPLDYSAAGGQDDTFDQVAPGAPGLDSMALTTDMNGFPGDALTTQAGGSGDPASSTSLGPDPSPAGADMSPMEDDMTRADQDTPADVGARSKLLSQVDVRLLLKADAASFTQPAELALMPINNLQGVSEQARNVLAKMAIKTIVDLATSVVFAHANLIHKAARDPQQLYAAAGAVPLDYLNDGIEDIDRRPEKLIEQSVSILRGIPPPKVTLDTLKAALNIEKVRDLALYPPYVAALTILDVINPVADVNAPPDPEAPSELLPKVGVFSTERVSYQKILVDQLAAGYPQAEGQFLDPLPRLNDIGDESKGGIDLRLFATLDKPVLGAAVTLQQEWFQEGVALGSLLYSAALAPGESTRIAVTEASSTTKTSTTESMSQTEQSDTSTSANRSIRDVVKQVQDSQSVRTQENESRNAGGSSSGSASYHGVGYSVSASYYASANNTKVTSNVGIAGQTNTAASAVSDAVDSTHQAAVSSRNQRAAMVTEVTQEQSKSTKSRVLANYNRMHALTVQYYEVVQIYRVSTTISKVQPLIFIPMKPITDWDDSILDQYCTVLAAAAPTPEFRRLFSSCALEQSVTVLSQRAPPAAKPPIGWAKDMEQMLAPLVAAGHSVTDGPGLPWYLPAGGVPAPSTAAASASGTGAAAAGPGPAASPAPAPPAAPAPAPGTGDSPRSKNGSTQIKAARLSPVVGRDLCPIAAFKLVCYEESKSKAGILVKKGDGNTLASSFKIDGGPWAVEDVASIEVCTLNVDVDFRLDIDLQIQWPHSTAADKATYTYTTYFKNAFDADLAEAEAAAQKSADAMKTLLWKLDGDKATKESLMNMIDNAGSGGKEVASGGPSAAPKDPPQLAPFTAVEFQLLNASEEPPRSALEELNKDSLRYNQAIWASMDPAMLSMHLSAFSFNGAPLFGQIEPTPVAVTGNLVGFVMRGDDSMRFGAANQIDLWTYVAEDLAVKEFGEQGKLKRVEQQADSAKNAMSQSASVIINDNGQRTKLKALLEDASNGEGDERQRAEKASKVYEALKDLKRAVNTHRRIAQDFAKLTALKADLKKDQDTEINIIIADAAEEVPSVSPASGTSGQSTTGTGADTSTQDHKDSGKAALAVKPAPAAEPKSAPLEYSTAALGTAYMRGSTTIDGSWGAWKEARGLVNVPPQNTTVALPTGGVFAEAVLGRCNAAEKKDYYRFTDWDKYKVAASLATKFSAQRSDGLLQNAAAQTAQGFDAANLIKGKSFDFSDVVNLADQAGGPALAGQVFNQMMGGGMGYGYGDMGNMDYNGGMGYGGMGYGGMDYGGTYGSDPYGTGGLGYGGFRDPYATGGMGYGGTYGSDPYGTGMGPLVGGAPSHLLRMGTSGTGLGSDHGPYTSSLSGKYTHGSGAGLGTGTLGGLQKESTPAPVSGPGGGAPSQGQKGGAMSDAKEPGASGAAGGSQGAVGLGLQEEKPLGKGENLTEVGRGIFAAATSNASALGKAIENLPSNHDAKRSASAGRRLAEMGLI